jgi:hypothetical protein
MVGISPVKTLALTIRYGFRAQARSDGGALALAADLA